MATLDELEARLQALEDIHAITQLKHRYFRHLDHKEWGPLRACFTEDVETHYESGHYRFEGIEDVMRFLSESLEGLTAGGRVALHLGHHPEIELLGPTSARGRWTLHAPIVETADGCLGSHDSFYLDEYRKEGDDWRICRIGYESYTQIRYPAQGLEASIGEESDSRAVNANARAVAQR